MKNIFVFVLLLTVGVFSFDDETYLTGFANQLGFTQDQISEYIDCFSQVTTEIQDFQTTVTNDGTALSDTEIVDFVQQVKYTLMTECADFETDMKTYFYENTQASVFKLALCDSLDTYGTEIKQELVTWASTLSSGEDLEAGKSQAYIYQILFGVVDPTTDPIASFTYSVSYLAASFDASGSSDPDGSISTYEWDFGETSSASNTASASSSSGSHTYSATGTYTVTLTVTDNDGNTASTTSSVKINAYPTAIFTYTLSDYTFSFDATGCTDSDGSISTYAWDFGESGSASNTASGSTASHAYSSTGIYTVTLTVTDDDGGATTYSDSVRINTPPTASFTYTITDDTISFDATGSTDSDGSITTYAWDFGESSSASNTDSGLTTSHTYASTGTYTVSLTVTDSDGATTTKTTPIKINAYPTAIFTYTISDETISFDATGCTDSDGSISTYAWNFGESSSASNTGSGSTASHTYATTGTYTVTLTVTDDDGATTTYSDSIRINTPPTASFTYTLSGYTFSFDASGSADSDGSISAYAWDFGESSSASNTGSGSTTSHTYATTGTYTVTLTVTDSDGATTTLTQDVRINTLPTASFSTSVTHRGVTFDAGTSTDSDGTIATYTWDFGEPSSSSNTATESTSTTTHTYASTGGTFTITLTVTDNDGGSSSTTSTVTVAANVAPTASFTYTYSTSGNQVTFSATATDSDGTISDYSWDFGESTSSDNTQSGTSSSAIHVYANSGTYTVTLTVTDNEGDSTTVTQSVTISSTCGNLLHFLASWDKEGDYDLIVLLPTGNTIGYWNTGPSSSTSYGKLIQDSGDMATPEETCWADSYTPPSGTYYFCLNPYSTSGGLPATGTVSVIVDGVTTVFTKSLTEIRQTKSCSTDATSYVGSITYP